MVSAKQDPPTSKRMSNAVRIAILSPGVLLFISAVRLLIIANYDPTTASAIASSSGIVGTLLGTLIPIVPALLPLLVLAFIVFPFRKPLLLLLAVIGTALVSPAYATLKEAWLATVNQFIAFGHAFAVFGHALSMNHPKLIWDAFGLSWLHDRAALIFGAAAVLAIAYDNRERLLSNYSFNKSKLEDSIVKALIISVGLLIPAALIYVFYSALFFFATTIYHIPYSINKIAPIASQPWLPSEKVTLKSGSTFVGYTLNAGDVWQVFLQERNRTIDYFHSGDVVSRTLCQLPEAQRPNRSPLIKLINAPAPIVPPCPKGP